MTASLAARGCQVLTFDLDLLMKSGLSIGEGGSAVRLGNEWIDLSYPRAGWLRRLHSAEWGLGVETGSVKALELGTWHSALSWLIETTDVTWITEPRKLAQAESKLRQWRVARDLGVSYPRTLVTTSSEDVARTFEGQVIVKPLGTGQFIAEGDLKVVYAEPMSAGDERLKALQSAPFIVQERLAVRRHIRAVTVGRQLWSASLEVDVTDPADWRRRAVNHSSFKVVDNPGCELREGAVGIAEGLGLGYTSQDWIETPSGETYLLDVNPAGQWLFLPEPIGPSVAAAIADQLMAEK